MCWPHNPALQKSPRRMLRYLKCDVGDETESSQHGVFNVSVQSGEVVAIKDGQEGGQTKCSHLRTTTKPQQVQTGLFTCTATGTGRTHDAGFGRHCAHNWLKMATTAVKKLTGRWEANWEGLHQVSFLQGVSRVDKPFPYSRRVHAAAWQSQHRSVRLRNNNLNCRITKCAFCHMWPIWFCVLPSCLFSNSSP